MTKDECKEHLMIIKYLEALSKYEMSIGSALELTKVLMVDGLHKVGHNITPPTEETSTAHKQKPSVSPDTNPHLHNTNSSSRYEDRIRFDTREQ